MRNRNSMLILICVATLSLVSFPLLADESHHCAKANESTCCNDKAECCKAADATCSDTKSCCVDAKCSKDKDGVHTCSMVDKDSGANAKCGVECCKHSCLKPKKA